MQINEIRTERERKTQRGRKGQKTKSKENGKEGKKRAKENRIKKREGRRDEKGTRRNGETEKPHTDLIFKTARFVIISSIQQRQAHVSSRRLTNNFPSADCSRSSLR